MPSLKRVKKPVLVGVIAVIGFGIGILFTTGAGEYWLTLFDSFGATGLTFIAFAELIAVMYVYGHKRFTEDIQRMTGVRPGIYWQIMWRFVSPALMSAVIVSSMYFMCSNTPEYSAWVKDEAKSVDKQYTTTGLAIAAILAVSSLVPIVIGTVVHFIRRCSNASYYTREKIHRVDTNASTHPMMDNFEEFHDLPVGADDSDSDSDSDSGRRISIGPIISSKQPHDFSLEVID